MSLKTREEYSEELESRYRILEKSYFEAKKSINRKIIAKNPHEILDPVYDFFVKCYHLREWTGKDLIVEQIIKDKRPSFVFKEPNLSFSEIARQICRDLCNRIKHRQLDKKSNDRNTKIIFPGESVFIVPFDELSAANKDKKTLHLKEEDAKYLGDFLVSFKGNTYKLGPIIEECMECWKNYFETNDLLLPRATPYNHKKIGKI